MAFARVSKRVNKSSIYFNSYLVLNNGNLADFIAY